MALYAQITLAICDDYPGGLEGFAPISTHLPASVFAAAIEDGQPMSQSGGAYSVFLDLMDEDDTQADEKCIHIDQAANILGLPSESLIPIGRQRLAQINDEAADYVAARRPTHPAGEGKP